MMYSHSAMFAAAFAAFAAFAAVYCHLIMNIAFCFLI